MFSGSSNCPPFCQHVMFPGTGGPPQLGLPGCEMLPGVPPGSMTGMGYGPMPSCRHGGHGAGAGATPAVAKKEGNGKKERKEKKPQTEDDPPWTASAWGVPQIMDDKAAAKAYLHQVFNCPYPIVDQEVHTQIRFLVSGACKDQVVATCKRFLECGGVYSLRVLEVLQHLPAQSLTGMIEVLELLSDLSKSEWHCYIGRVITLAHEHKERAKAAVKEDEERHWKAFTDIVGKTRVPWPAPPEQIGWTMKEMYPVWNGEQKTVPPHMQQVLIPKYWVQMCRK